MSRGEMAMQRSPMVVAMDRHNNPLIPAFAGMSGAGRAKSILVSLICALLAVLGIAAVPARADITVDVNQAAVQPLPIAVPGFSGAAPYGDDIAKVISANLQRSGLFKPLEPATFTDKTVD